MLARLCGEIACLLPIAPPAHPQMPLSFGSVDRQSRGGAEWVTTYCDDDMRIGKGKASGNVFLFFKRQPE